MDVFITASLSTDCMYAAGGNHSVSSESSQLLPPLLGIDLVALVPSILRDAHCSGAGYKRVYIYYILSERWYYVSLRNLFISSKSLISWA